VRVDVEVQLTAFSALVLVELHSFLPIHSQETAQSTHWTRASEGRTAGMGALGDKTISCPCRERNLCSSGM